MTNATTITTEQLLKQSIPFGDTVFCLGADFKRLRPELVGLDRQKNLGLGSVLHPTPPWWVVAKAYRMARRMVSNEEYAQFWNAPDFMSESEGGCGRFIERPDLWTTVWEAARIQNCVYHRPPEYRNQRRQRTEPWVEHYADATNVIQAVIKSFRYEAYRIFGLPFPAPEEVPQHPPEKELITQDAELYERRMREYLIAWVFSGMAYLFRAFYEDEQLEADITLLFAEKEIGYTGFIEDFLDRTEQLERHIIEVTKQNCDPKFKATFGYKAAEVEIVQILQRCRRALTATNGDHSAASSATTAPQLRVHAVFYPRVWEDPQGLPAKPITGAGGLKGALKGAGGLKGGALKGGQVPWETRPVMGMSLYEAMAYVTWMTQFTYDDGYLVKLPSEAEFERAASWPQAGWDPSNGEIQCRYEVKALFPWEPAFNEHDDPAYLKNVMDFSTFFGDQAKSLDGFYFQNKARLSQLLDDTSRPVAADDGEHDRIEMLLGFGWQWTEDRYQETEDGYNRFENNQYNLRSDIRAYFEGQRVPVFDYFAPGFNPDWSYFVGRGAPEILGGPGTATRRFALLPLRGYRQVGFRWVLQEVKEI